MVTVTVIVMDRLSSWVAAPADRVATGADWQACQPA